MFSQVLVVMIMLRHRTFCKEEQTVLCKKGNKTILSLFVTAVMFALSMRYANCMHMATWFSHTGRHPAA